MKEFTGGKHIALVIRLLAGRSGGAERIYCELANFLVAKGYRVSCLHFDKSDAPPFYPLDSRIELINLFGKDLTRKQFWARILKSVNFLSEGVKNKALWDEANDFFLTQLKDYFNYAKPAVAISLMPPANTPSLLASVGTAVKVVATNHNVPEQDYTSPVRWDPNPLDRELRLKTLDHAAAIHVLFPAFGEWFPENLRDRIVAIPNYISEEFKTEAEVGGERENLILAVGRLAPVKNYLQLVRSWSQIAHEFPDWSVLIYGTGPQKRELQAEIARLGLQDTFRLGGHRGDLGREYARASIFCHPAHFEGFGLSPAEALFMRTPVIAYADCPGVNQFVKNGVNGLAIQRDEDGTTLAEALRTLIQDAGLRKKLGEEGPSSVAAFSTERYVDNWITLIEKLTREEA